MKLRSLSPIIVGLTVTVSTLLVQNSTHASSANQDYVCAQLNGVWTTWVRDSRGGMLPLIRWTNDKIAGWTPKTRCIEVSNRMKRLADNGLFNQMSGGVVNGQPVICGVRRIGESCSDRNLIVTLKPNDNPTQKIHQLLDIGSRARGNVIELSGNDEASLETIVNGQTYVNMEVFKGVLEKSTTSVPPSQLTPVE